MKNTVPAFLVATLIFIACETIYNYDLNYTITAGNQATRNAIDICIPGSVNLRKGTIDNEMILIFRNLDASEQQISDSLRKDIQPANDTSIILNIDISALDPENGLTTYTYNHTYSLTGL